MPVTALPRSRPRIAILGRFAETTSALRYRAVVNARALLEAVWAAGGDPVTLLPVAGAEHSITASRCSLSVADCTL